MIRDVVTILIMKHTRQSTKNFREKDFALTIPDIILPFCIQVCMYSRKQINFDRNASSLVGKIQSWPKYVIQLEQ